MKGARKPEMILKYSPGATVDKGLPVSQDPLKTAATGKGKMTLSEEIPDHLGQGLIQGSLEFFRIKGDLLDLR